MSTVRPGVGIVAPGAAEIVGAFQEHEVMQVPLFELDPEAETREAGADDDDFMIHTDLGLHVFHCLSRTSSYVVIVLNENRRNASPAAA